MKKILFSLFICIAVLFTTNNVYAAFPIHLITNNDVSYATNDTTAADVIERDGNFLTFSPGHHKNHRHFHGFWHHSERGHYYNPEKFHHSYRHIHNQKGYFFSAISFSLIISSIFVFILWGSLAAICCSIVAVLFGGIGLVADKYREMAITSFAISLVEAVLLLTLYLLCVI